MSYIELTTLLNVKRLPFFCYSLEVSLFSSVSFPMHTAFTHIHLIYFAASLSSSLPLSLSLPLLILCFSFSRMLNLVVSRKNIHWLLFCLLHFVPPRAFRGFHFILLHFWFVFDSLFLLIAAAALTFAPLFVRQNATFHLLTLCSAHTHTHIHTVFDHCDGCLLLRIHSFIAPSAMKAQCMYLKEKRYIWIVVSHFTLHTFGLLSLVLALTVSICFTISCHCHMHTLVCKNHTWMWLWLWLWHPMHSSIVSCDCDCTITFCVCCTTRTKPTKYTQAKPNPSQEQNVFNHTLWVCGTLGLHYPISNPTNPKNLKHREKWQKKVDWLKTSDAIWLYINKTSRRRTKVTRRWMFIWEKWIKFKRRENRSL